jgi:hypothetical protein
MNREIPLSEPVAVVDTFVSGVAYVEELSPNLYRVVYYADQRAVYDGSRERAVAARFIVSGETLAAMSRATAEGLKCSPEFLDIPEGAIAN